MNKNLKEALMSVPPRPEVSIEEIPVSRHHWYRWGGVGLVASLLLCIGVATLHLKDTTVSDSYTAAEEVESELIYIVDYFNGEDVDEEFEDYALSSDF